MHPGAVGREGALILNQFLLFRPDLFQPEFAPDIELARLIRVDFGFLAALLALADFWRYPGLSTFLRGAALLSGRRRTLRIGLRNGGRRSQNQRERRAEAGLPDKPLELEG